MLNSRHHSSVLLRKSMEWLSALLVSTCIIPWAAAADLDLLDDIPLLSELTPLLLPEGNDAFVDSSFGTAVRRLSHAIATQDNADPSNGNVQFIAQEYSTVSPFNADNSLLLLLHFSYFALYDGNGNYIRDLPFEVHASSHPRWSHGDPGVFYFLAGNQLRRFDVESWSSSIVREFPEYNRLSGLGESDISYDGDHLVLVGDDRQIFVYTLSTDNKGGVLAADVVRNIDNVHITPDNNVIVGWYAQGSGRGNGYELFDRNMVFKHQLTTILGHMDVTRDVDGSEIMLWHNAAEPDPLAGCENGIVKVGLGDGGRSCMVTFPWGLGVHISAADFGGWFVASTYVADRAFSPPDEPQIMRVDLEGLRIQRLVQHGSKSFDNYRSQPKAATSRDGSHVVYASNYGQQSTLGYPADYTDAYLITDYSGSPITAIDRLGDSGGDDETPADSGEDEELPGNSESDLGSDSGSGDSGSGGANGNSVGTEKSSEDVGSAGGDTSVPPAPVTQSCDKYFRDLTKDQVSRVEEYGSDADYQGKWRTFSHAKLSGRKITASNEAGASVSFNFAGTAVGWVGYIGPWGGTAHVYIDNVLLTDVDTRYARHTIKERIFVVKDLWPGKHTLTLEVADQEGLDSSGIWIDAFEFINPGSPLHSCYPDSSPIGLMSRFLTNPD